MARASLIISISLILFGCATTKNSENDMMIRDAKAAILNDLLIAWLSCTKADSVSLVDMEDYEYDIRKTGIAVNTSQDNQLFYNVSEIGNNGEAIKLLSYLNDDFCRVSRSYQVTSLSVMPLSSLSMGVVE